MHRFCQRSKPVIAAAVAGIMLVLASASCNSKETDYYYIPELNYEKQPYLVYAGDNTKMTVQWQLTKTAGGQIEWGTTEGVYDLGSVATTENSPEKYQHVHHYTISGLTPGSTYYYRVTTPGGAYTGSFSAAPDITATSLKFIAYGDTRTYWRTHEALAGTIEDLYASDPAYRTLIAAVGDLVTEGGLEVYWTHEFFRDSMVNLRSIMRSVPYFTAVGNHDIKRDDGVLFKKYFPYPFESSGGRYWSFDYGPAHFAIVDGYTDFSTGSAQHGWLDTDLSAAAKPWKFVVVHQPGWSAGGGHENYTSVQDYIEPLCETYGVDILFAGHNHYYARAEVPYDTGKTVYHITTGGGGAPLHTPNPAATYVVKTSRSHHFCAVEIDGNTLTLRAIDIGGNEIDAFTITKP